MDGIEWGGWDGWDRVGWKWDGRDRVGWVG